MMKPYPFKNIGIETTSICNSACEVCPREAYYKGPVATMAMDMFEKIVVEINDNEYEEELRFAGIGDPSCDKRLIERLRFCRQRTPGLKLAVLSNMAVWKDSYSDLIVAERLLDDLRCSVFAVSENKSEQAYGKPDQAGKARRAIEHFHAKNEEAGRPVDLSIYTLLAPDNEAEVRRIKEVYWDMADAFEIWRPHGWANLMPHLRPHQEKRRACSRVENFEVTIRANGEVTACSMDINHNLVYGDMNHQTLYEILNGEAYRRFHDLNRGGKIETLDTCRGCSFLNAEETDALVERKSKLRDAG
jgi:radical SAM protein with 4Fe4S-binding SPASM domain